MRLQHWILFAFLLNYLPQLTSQSDSSKKKWTPDAIINTEYIRSVDISPDGRLVVWAKRKALKKEDKFVSNLFLTRLDSRKDSLYRTVPLTTGKDNDYAPFFSKDSETIYFLSGRDKGKKLWSLSVFGGEAREVYEFENGISSVKWLDEDHLLLISNDGKTLRETELEKAKDNVVIVEDEEHWKIRRLYKFSLKNQTLERVTSNNFPISSYAVSRDGNWLVYSTQQSRHYASDAHPDPKYYLRNLQTGDRMEILANLQTPYNFQFTADSRGFYFAAVQSSDPEWNGAGSSKVYYYDLAVDTYRSVPLDWKWDSEGSLQVIGNDVLVGLANGTTLIPTLYRKNGNNWTKSTVNFADKNEYVSILDVTDDFKKVVYQYSKADQMPRYYVADLSSNGDMLRMTNETELAKVNKSLKDHPITRYEVMKWAGWNDEEVDGLLFYPADYQAGKRYPLVVSIHGGPSGSDMDRWSERWSTYPQILAQKGAFVLKPNYHGSSHHGQQFVESIKGHYYDLELEDIWKGIRVLETKGLIDTSQMGVMGWSNGAILATMLTVRYPDMFKVCAAGAGDVNWTSDFGTCRFGVQFDQSYFGGAPWDDVNGKSYNETYILKSPLFELEKVKTPTIIFHGSEDRAVPRDQGWEYYRALQQIDKAPVRFLWFPGQPHGLQKITHQRRKMEEEIAWMDQYLFNDYQPKNESFKMDSPLANLLKKDSLADQNGLYGHLVKGKLVPEVAVVKKDSIALGVLEVTNAQWQAYQSAHTFPKGQDNYPVTVAAGSIEGYMKWLNQTTGRRYRLPNAAEAKVLHKSSRKVAGKENTLRYWAGYDITPDEVADFRKKLTGLDRDLSMEVAQFPSVKVGKANLYDLGGNVAEYAADGSIYGFGAYDYADKAATEPKRVGKAIGFRVVREE